MRWSRLLHRAVPTVTLEANVPAHTVIIGCLCVVSLACYLVSENPKVKEVARLLFLASATALFIRA